MPEQNEYEDKMISLQEIAGLLNTTMILKRNPNGFSQEHVDAVDRIIHLIKDNMRLSDMDPTKVYYKWVIWKQIMLQLCFVSSAEPHPWMLA